MDRSARSCIGAAALALPAAVVAQLTVVDWVDLRAPIAVLIVAISAVSAAVLGAWAAQS